MLLKFIDLLVNLVDSLLFWIRVRMYTNMHSQFSETVVFGLALAIVYTQVVKQAFHSLTVKEPECSSCLWKMWYFFSRIIVECPQLVIAVAL